MSAGGPRQVVLAAGRSRRMGRPKPLLDFDGRTALDLVLDAGQSGGCAGSIVVVGHREEDVRIAHRNAKDVEWILNDDPESDQLRSLQLGLEALGEDTAFCMQPVDVPLVEATDYRLLIDAWRSDPQDAAVYFLTCGSRHGHPVLCRPAVARKLLALGPDSTARVVLRKEPAARVNTANEGVLRNMNTPEDYAALLEVYRRRRG